MSENRTKVCDKISRMYGKIEFLTTTAFGAALLLQCSLSCVQMCEVRDERVTTVYN